MDTTWEGYYLNGQTADRHCVVVRMSPHSLDITLENGVVFRWPYNEIRQTQGSYTGEQARLERGEDTPEILIFVDPSALQALEQVAPDRLLRSGDPVRRSARIKVTIAAVTALVVIAAMLYTWAIPALARHISTHIPVSWEERIGERVAAQVAVENRVCTKVRGMEAINAILDTLVATQPSSPYRFRVLVVDDPTVNAFAAPGGLIVVYRGLLEKTRSPEELAGVLAHEIQHVLKRHTTRALVESMTVAFLLAAVGSGQQNSGPIGAALLSQLQFSRQHEEEADRTGVQMLVTAGIDPQGMIHFFDEMLGADEHDIPAIVSYLSTHPHMDDRVANLTAVAAQAPPATRKLLPSVNWNTVANMC